MQWYVTNGVCADSVAITVTNNNFSVFAGANDTVCTDTIQMFAQSPLPGTGYWNLFAGSGVFDNSNSSTTIIRNLGQGDNIFEWTITKNGCSNSDFVTIVNNTPSDAIISNPADFTQTCNGSITLTAAPITYGVGHWEQIAGSGMVGHPIVNPVTVNGLSVNNNIFVWVIENGRCVLSDTITIINNQIIADAGTNDTVCSNTTQLHAVDPSSTIYGGTGQWFNLSGGGVTFVDNLDPDTYVNNLPRYSPITLQWVVTKGDCSLSDNVTVLNYSVDPQASDKVVCEDFTQITANAYINPPEIGYWTVGNPYTAVLVDDASNNICDVTNLSPATNQFTWHITNSICTDSVTIFVTNNGFAVNADANGSLRNVCSDTYILSGDNPTPGTGFWTVIAGTGIVTNSTLFNSTVTNLTTTPTLLEWTVNKFSCSASNQVTIINNGVIANATPHLYTCTGNVALEGVNPNHATGLWKKVIPASSGTIVTPTLYNSQFTGIANQTTVALNWVITSTVGGCQDSVQVLVTNNRFSLSAGINDTTCADTIVLHADNPAPGTGFWQVIAGSGDFDNSTMNSTIVRNIGTGDNVYTWTVNKLGCDNSAQVIITNNSVVANAGFDQLNLCVDNTTITGNDVSGIGGTGYWDLISGGGNIVNSTAFSTIVNNLSTNNNTFRWTVNARGCTDYDDVVIRNNSFTVEAGLPQTVCADSAQLNGVVVTGGNGTWTPQGGTPATPDQPDVNNTWVHNLQQGTNTFRWTVTRNGCSFYDDVIITNDLPNPPQLISSDQLICIDSVQLQAVAPEVGTTGRWTYSGPGGTILVPTNNNTWCVDMNYGTTEFIWTVKHNACSISDQFNVTNGGVTANAGSDQNSLCQNFTSLNAVNPTAPAFGYWTYLDGTPVIQNSASNVTDVSNLGYGTNRFVWNVEKGICDATDTVIIINNSASVAEVGSVPPSCTGQANLNATPPLYGDGEWGYIGTYPVNILTPSASNTLVTNLEYGANLFTWTVTNTTPYAVCSNDTSFTVVNNQFTVSAGNDQFICDNSTYLQAGTRPFADSSYWVVLTGSPVIDDSTDPTSQITLGQGQSTVLQWFVYENGCVDDDIVAIQNKGVTAVAYDDEVCSSNTTLTAQPEGAGNSGYWTTATGTVSFIPDNSQYDASVTGLDDGANSFTWHVYNAYCEDSVTININYLIPEAYAGPSVSICNDEHTLSANDPSEFGGTGVWTVVSGSGTFTNASSYNSGVTDLDNGPNTFRWTVTLRGCQNSSLVTITNNKPTISVGATQNICESSTVLTGNNPALDGNQGVWTKFTGGTHVIVNSTLFNTQVTGMANGTHIFTWTVWNSNCAASENLIVNNNTIVAIAGNDFPTCTDSVRLSAVLPANSTGYWESTTAGPIIVNSTLYNTWVTNLNGDNNNMFRWTVTANGCSDDDFVVVDNNSVFVNAGDDQNICQNQTYLEGNNPITGSGYWVKVSGDGQVVNSTLYNSLVINLGEGANVFKWTISSGDCMANDEVTINNNQVFADAGSGDESLCATSFELNAIPAQTGQIGYWSVTGGAGVILNSTAYNTWVTNLARGENILRWTVQSTTTICSSYDEVSIINITPSQAVTAPNKEICTDYTTITANEPVYGLGHWQVVSGPPLIYFDDSNDNSTTVHNLGTGPNSFVWIITDPVSGCSTSDTIEVINSSVTSFAGLNQEICVDTFKLQASNPSSGYGMWTKVSPYGNFDVPTVHNTIVRNIGMGPNTYRWTVYSGICSASDEVVITNNTATVADAGDDQISCDGTATLVGSTPDLDESGLWTSISGGGTIQNETRYYTGVSGLSYGDNRYVWTITRGSCESMDTVTVTNNNINVYAGENQEVCTDSVYLRANVPTFGTGIWQLSGGSGTILISNNNETAVIGLAPGVNTFKWIITEGVCSAYDEVQITNNEPTNPQVCNDTILTCLDYTNLCANLPPDGEIGFWTRLSGNGVIDETYNPNTLVTELSSTSSFIWTIQKGSCQKTDTLFIKNGIVNALTSVDTLEVCGTDGNLSANDPLIGSGVWTKISGSGIIDNSTSYITTVSGLDEGANTFRWTVTSGSCSGSDDMTLLNNLYPATANMAGTNPICENQVMVIGNPPDAGAIGFWSFVSGYGGYFEDSNAPATLAYDIGNGTNTARWTVKKGSCENYADVQIINRTIVAQANSPVIVCSSDDIGTLVANDPSPATGYWTLVSGSLTIANTTAFSTSVTNVDYGSNGLTWTVTNGSCSDDVSVMVLNNFFTVTAGNDRTVCDTTTILSGTNPGTGGTGLWTLGGGSGNFEVPSNYTTRVNGLIQGNNTFIWTVSKDGCSASDEVVIYNGLPTAVAGGDQVICQDSTQLAASLPSVGTGMWSNTGGSGVIVNPNLNNTMVRNIGYGQSTYRWTVTNGQCQAYDDIVIYNNTVTQTAGENQEVCFDYTTLAADPPGTNGTGYWTNGGGGGVIVNPTLYNSQVTGLFDGVNTFWWTVTANGCSASTPVQIINNRFDVYAGDDQTVYVENTTLNAQVITGCIGTWTIYGGGGDFANIHDAGTYVDELQYGVNTFTWTVYNPVTGCSAFDDVEITYNGFNVYAGPTQYICADTTTMDADDVVNATTYWTIDFGSCNFEDPTDPDTYVYNLARGLNILRWNVTKNGFTSYDTVHVYNYAFDITAGDDQHLCDNTTYLDGSSPLNTPWNSGWTGTWTNISGGGYTVDPTDQNTQYVEISPDSNLVQWKVVRDNYPGSGTSECAAVDYVNIIYHQMPQSSFMTDPEIGRGCSPLNVSFINTTPTDDTIPGTLYRWNFADQGITIPIPYDSIPQHTFENYSYEDDTVYTVTMISTVMIASGLTCTDTAYADITVWPVPKANFTAAPINTVFPNSLIDIENQSTTNCNVYSWSFGDGGTAVDYDFKYNYSHYYNNWGTYTITLEIWNEHCTSTHSQVVQVIAPLPVSGGNNNVEGCAPLNIQLLGFVNYDTPSESEYKWVILKDGSPDTVAVIDRKDPIYTFTEAGTYFAKFWASGEGSNPPWSMTYIRTDTIVVYPVPVASFEVSPMEVMIPQPIHCYNYSENAYRYLWNFGTDEFSPNADTTKKSREPVITYLVEGEYEISLQVWTDKGCTDKMILELPVNVVGSGNLIFPTAFIPDPFGPTGGTVQPGHERTNKIFLPQLVEGVIDYHLQIYNRWGEILYESFDVYTGWDGYVKDVLAPQDVYVYKANVTFKNGTQQVFTGSVTLLR